MGDGLGDVFLRVWGWFGGCPGEGFGSFWVKEWFGGWSLGEQHHTLKHNINLTSVSRETSMRFSRGFNLMDVS